MTTDNQLISGWKTVADWKSISPQLVGNSDPKLWSTVFQDYFLPRLNLRYLEPIKILQGIGTSQGEGYSILAIQCSLIEFLEATVQGVNYRYLKKGQSKGAYEYYSSREKFVEFLSGRHPFSVEFSKGDAEQFYEHIRCGILHEARTTNGWKVWARGPKNAIVDIQSRIVFRNGFQTAILSFIKWYENELVSTPSIQQAFIRKYNDLCA